MGSSAEAEAGLLQVRNRQIAAVHNVSRKLSSTLDLDDRLRDIVTVSMQAVDAVAGTLYLYRAADNKLVFRHVVGEKAAELTGQSIDATAGVSGAVFQSGQPQITNRPEEASEHRSDIDRQIGFESKSILTVPLQYEQGKPVGVMQILNKRSGEFDAHDLEVLEIVAAIAAGSIENAQLHRDAQMAAVARAVGDLSHDIKNKVTPISLTAMTLRPTIADMLHDLDTLAADAPDTADRIEAAVKWVREDYNEQLDIVLDQVKAVQDYTKLIADTLKGIVTEPELTPNDLSAVLEAQLRELDVVAAHSGVRIIRDFGDVPRFRFDKNHIERAVYNLTNNAIPETPSGGHISIRTWCKLDGEFPTGGYACIEVADTGKGMPKHVLERVLRGDAKSTKPGGTGLGTKIVFSAVQAHKGLFEGASKEGAGTQFRLLLPLAID